MDNDTNHPIDPASPPTVYVVEPVAEATAPTHAATAHPSRSRTWLIGAALVAAGALAGGGATYAVAGSSTPSQAQVTQRQGGGPAGMGRGELGVPPQDDDQLQQQGQGTQPTVPDQTAPDQTAPDEPEPEPEPSTADDGPI